MKQLLFIFLLLPLLLACGDKSNIAYEESQVAMLSEAAADNGRGTAVSIPEKDLSVALQNKKIIKDGRLGIQVTELNKTKEKIDAALTLHNGYYGNESFQDNHYENRFTLYIRIPSANYEKFIAEIENGNGKVLYKEVTARDVTDQFVDLEIRLANKRSYLNRYRELVKQAKTIKEVLEVEAQIRVLEEEIESAEGRLRLMSDQVNYSTLELTLIKEIEYTYTPDKRDRFFERVKEAFFTGWYVFVDVVLFVLAIWPLWIVLGMVVYFVRRKKKNKKQ